MVFCYGNAPGRSPDNDNLKQCFLAWDYVHRYWLGVNMSAQFIDRTVHIIDSMQELAFPAGKLNVAALGVEVHAKLHRFVRLSSPFRMCETRFY